MVSLPKKQLVKNLFETFFYLAVAIENSKIILWLIVVQIGLVKRIKWALSTEAG